MLLFAVTTAVRFAFLLGAPFTLSPDEAYYWDWSRHLDWGYYSKPPAVAWIMALSTWIFGDFTWAVRLPALLMNLGSMWFVALVSSRMFSEQAGFLATLFMALAPASAVAAFVMTIDAPLLFFWSMALYCLWRAVEPSCPEGERKKGWWIAAGLATGAGLLAKQTMAAFPAGTFFFLLLVPDGRKILKTVWPWLYLLLSFFSLAPVIWWNYRHDWITLEHTAHHFAGTDFSLIDSAGTLFEFLGSQAGIYSPLLWLLLFMAGVMACRAVLKRLLPYGKGKYRVTAKGCRCRDLAEGKAVSCLGSFLSADLPERLKREWMAMLFLVSTGFLMLIPVICLSMRQHVNANWPAPFYISLLVLAAGWCSGGFACFSELAPPPTRYVRISVGCAAFLTLCLYAGAVILPLTPVAGAKHDPLARITGWDRLGKSVQEIYDSLPSPERVFIVTRRRQTASALAFYMPSHPVVYRWNGINRHISTQYEIWDAPVDRVGDDALIVLDMNKELVPDLAGCFEDVEFVKSIYLSPRKEDARYFNVYIGRNMRHWTKR
jgi:4-amino-4-deoxy-L-arabinose transferase-like glycosyltransferase